MSMREWLASENSIGPELLVFVLGGTAYAMMEILFRGHTHWSMALTGGACVVTLYILLDWLNGQPLVMAALAGAVLKLWSYYAWHTLAGAVIVTVYEFAVGCIVNLRFGWAVWDYSDMEGNLLGQICPVFTAAWFALCFLFLGVVRLLS